MVYYYTRETSFDNSWEGVEKLNSLKLVKERLEEADTICLDCETNGLDPHVNKIYMLQFGIGEDQFVVDTRGLDVQKHFGSLLETEDKVFVGHNIKFDYNMLKQYNIVLRNVYDTMQVDKVIYNDKYSPDWIRETGRFQLKGVYKHYTGHEISKTERLEFLHWKDKPFTYEQVIYGAKDVVYPMTIKEHQDLNVKRLELQEAVKLENEAVLPIGDIEYNGFHMDAKIWLEAYGSYRGKLVQSLKELDQILVEAAPRYEAQAYQLSIFGQAGRVRLTNVNWSSSHQVLSILNNVFEVFPKDKHGKATTSTPELEAIYPRPPIVAALLKQRKHAKVVSSFGKKFIDKFLSKESRVHTSYNHIVGTGRMSSYKPNMQQIPRGEEFRKAFTAPEGKVLITADYANQEGRVMADMANDETYIDFFNNGEEFKGDAHSFVAQTLYSAAAGELVEVPRKPDDDATEEDKLALEYFDNHPNKGLRQSGKTMNFLIAYGGSSLSLALKLGITIKEADKLIDNYFKGFRGLGDFFDRAKKEAITEGMVRVNSVTNRIRWMRGWDRFKELDAKPFFQLTKEERSEKGKVGSGIERKGANTKIQGTAGDMTKKAMVLIRKELISKNIRPIKTATIKLVQVVHDEMVLEADEAMQDIGAAIIKGGMENAGTYFCNRVKMSAKPVVKKVWDH